MAEIRPKLGLTLKSFFICRLTLKIFYDKEFKGLFKGSSTKIVKKIVNHASSIFKWPSLGTSIELKTVEIKAIPGNYPASDDNL